MSVVRRTSLMAPATDSNPMRTLQILSSSARYAREPWLAQRWRGGGERILRSDAPVRTAREVPSHSTGTPNWTKRGRIREGNLDLRAHSFLRALLTAPGAPQTVSPDFPDSDLNLSFRVQQITAIKVDPDGRVVTLTDPDLSDYRGSTWSNQAGSSFVRWR